MSFYKTQVMRVGAGIAIDIQGKTLRFMGNLPCQAGSTVWTDGKFIFGNVSVKSQPAVGGGNILGIPVAFDDSLGYISSTGKLRAYKIADDLWIVNDDKIYKHGDDENIIDAEIDDNGDLWTVTNGLYQKNQIKGYMNHIYSPIYDIFSMHPESEYIWEWSAPTYGTFPFIDTARGQYIKLGNSNTLIDDKIVIYKNGETQEEINLKDYADIAEAAALAVKDKIMAKSQEIIQAAEAAIPSEDISTPEIINWTLQPEPPEDFIASSYAKVATFNIQKNGDWDAVIATSAFGYCFPHLVFDGSIFRCAFPQDEYKTPSTHLSKIVRRFELLWLIGFIDKKESICARINGEKITTAQYRDLVPLYFDRTKYKEALSSLPSTSPYPYDYYSAPIMTEYYISQSRFKYSMWFAMPFSATAIVKVHNGEITDTIYEKSGGGYRLDISGLNWNEKELTGEQYFDGFIVSPENDNKNVEWNFPLDENYYFSANGLSIESIYNSENEKVADISQQVNSLLHSQIFEAYFEYPFEWYTSIDNVVPADSRVWSFYGNSDVLRNTYIPLFGREIYNPKLHYKFVTATDTNIIYNSSPSSNDDYQFLSGWFNTSDIPISISHCFTELKKGGFLLGLRGGDLYKINADNTELIGNDLKNFRLRELKNINKAKR